MIILASASPRRQELIKMLTNDFVVIPSDVDESIIHTEPHALPAELSKLKAYSIFMDHPDDTVIACDTIVILEGKILGKPKSEEQAKEMLRALSGKKHVVISGYTYINKKKEITRTVRTYVYFNKLSEETIDAYVKSGSPMDKAGAYGIQDEEFNLVNHIEGSFYNVVGFPVEDIKVHCFKD